MFFFYLEKKKKKKILVFRKQTSCLQEARLRQQGVEKVGLFTLFLPLPYQSKKKKKRCVFGWVCMWNTGVYLCTMIVFGLDNLPAPPPPAKSGTEVNSSSIAANMALCCVDTQSSRYRSFKQELIHLIQHNLHLLNKLHFHPYYQHHFLPLPLPRLHLHPHPRLHPPHHNLSQLFLL